MFQASRGHQEVLLLCEESTKCASRCKHQIKEELVTCYVAVVKLFENTCWYIGKKNARGMIHKHNRKILLISLQTAKHGGLLKY